MNEGTTAVCDNLSNFSPKLKEIENTYIKEISVDLAHARSAVVGALPAFRSSRLNIGRILRTYKEQFKAARGWTAAVKVIADAVGCDERTADRIIEDYERASSLPALVIEAMEEQKINPAAAKNAPMIAKLAQVPQTVTREEAAEAVRAVVQVHAAQKKAAKKTGSSPASVTCGRSDATNTSSGLFGTGWRPILSTRLGTRARSSGGSAAGQCLRHGERCCGFTLRQRRS